MGRKLINEAIEEAKRMKCTGMMWQVLDWNEPALNFYRKFEGVSFDGAWLNGNL